MLYLAHERGFKASDLSRVQHLGFWIGHERSEWVTPDVAIERNDQHCGDQDAEQEQQYSLCRVANLFIYIRHRVLPASKYIKGHLKPMDHYDRIADLLSNPALTPEGSPMPIRYAGLKAAIILEWMAEHGIHPDRVVASDAGGIAAHWHRNGKYADVECLNSGEVLCMISDRKNPPIVWIMEI